MAILGRQNVGKSTLLNALVSENRVITGSVPGLTRDSIAVDFTYGADRPNGVRNFSIVDTAGIRKASLRDSAGDSIEDDSVRDAVRSLKLAHVCVLVLEAEKLHLTKQELTIADSVIREGRALVVVANKSDMLEGTPDEYAMGVKVRGDICVRGFFCFFNTVPAPAVLLTADRRPPPPPPKFLGPGGPFPPPCR